MNRFVFPVANLPSSFHEIANEVENAFDQLLSGKSGGVQGTPRYAPRLDAHEYDDKVVLAMDLPGVNPSDLKIEVKDNQLSISGERSAHAKSEGAKVWREERSYGKFQRTIQLPETANGDAIDALYDAGVLTVVVPKVPKPAPKQVTVRFSTPAASVENLNQPAE